MTAKLYLFYLHFKSTLILIKYILVRLSISFSGPTYRVVQSLPKWQVRGIPLRVMGFVYYNMENLIVDHRG